jgi:hypothetical protein
MRTWSVAVSHVAGCQAAASCSPVTRSLPLALHGVTALQYVEFAHGVHDLSRLLAGGAVHDELSIFGHRAKW